MKHHLSRVIVGIVQYPLFSPRGDIEGVLLKQDGQLLQISFAPDVGTRLAARLQPRKRLRVIATEDRTGRVGVDHAVYAFESLASADGQPITTTDRPTRLVGTVARIHYAKHGEANGVLLESGDFVHLRPHGMEVLKPTAGSRITAYGSMRPTVLGVKVLEAQEANGVQIE